MARIHTVIDEAIDHVRRLVYAVAPAAVDGKGEGWQAHLKEGGSILSGGERVRLFDVLCNAQVPIQILTEGCLSRDYAIPMQVIIVYGLHDDYAHLMASDYAAIYHALHNADVASVSGLNCYIVDGEPTVINSEDSRALVMNFTARITAE
jgi:hypothetical protein